MSDGDTANAAVVDVPMSVGAPPAADTPVSEPQPASAPAAGVEEFELPETDEPDDPPPAPVPNPPLDSAGSAPQEVHEGAPEPAPQPLQPVPVAPAPAITTYLGAALEKIQFRKRAKLDKIVVMAKKKGSITNNDVEALLRVSDSTATRYLSQLVLQGRLARSGTTTNIFYTAY